MKPRKQTMIDTIPHEELEYAMAKALVSIAETLEQIKEILKYEIQIRS